MKKSGTLFFFAAFILSVACSRGPVEGRITSGRIDYRISYLNDDIDAKTMELLPRRMKLIFNESHALNNIEGFLGFYRLDAITNFRTRKCSTILKVFDKNYLFRGKRDEMMCCFDSMEGMIIQETGETRTIAGFPCTKAVVSLPATGESFDIYYTRAIDLKNPNATNPYKKIDGVLMEFELKLLYLHMRFTAEKFQSQPDNPEHSTIPKDIRHISRDQMTRLLNKLMD